MTAARESQGPNEPTMRRQSSTLACNTLCDKIDRAIDGYAKRKGIAFHEAEWLLLNSGGCVN